MTSYYPKLIDKLKVRTREAYELPCKIILIEYQMTRAMKERLLIIFSNYRRSVSRIIKEKY